jgi:O-antigen/teichoic acid export membrane protein
MQMLKRRLYTWLRWSERYTKTDMVYLTTTGWWVNLGTVIISAFSLLLYVVFARVLPPEVYGTYQYILSGGALLAALTLTGMNSAVARAVARGHDQTIYAAARAQLRFSFLPLLVGFAVAGYYFIRGNTLFGLSFGLITLLTPFMSIFGSYASFLQGKKDFKRSFTYGMFWNIAYYIGLLLVAWLYPAVLPLVVACFGIQTVALGFVYFRALKHYEPQEPADEDSIAYGKHLSIMNFGTAVATQIDTIISFHLLGPAAVAIYSFATAIPERLTGFFKFLPAAALPKFASKTPEEMRHAFGPRIILAIVGMALVAGVYALFAPLVFTLLFPAYVGAVPYSQVYALVLIASISGLFTTALIAQRNVKELYAYTAITPAIQILLQVAGAFLYGLWGLIIARIASQLVSAVIAFVLLAQRR